MIIHQLLQKNHLMKFNTKKILELASEFSKITRYKVNTQKSIVFLFISNQQLETEKKIKYYLDSLKKEKV